MHEIRNILLLHDPRRVRTSELWRAAALARHHEAPLTVLEVVPKVPYEADVTVAGVDLSRAFLKERRRQLDYQLEPMREDGLDVRAEVRSGRPEEVLAECAHELGRGLILVGGAGRKSRPGLLTRLTVPFRATRQETAPAAA